MLGDAGRGKGFDLHLGFTARREVEFLASLLGNIHDDPAMRRHAIVDHQLYRLTVGQVSDLDLGARGNPAVGRGKSARILALAAGGAMAGEALAVACSHPGLRAFPFLGAGNLSVEEGDRQKRRNRDRLRGDSVHSYTSEMSVTLVSIPIASVVSAGPWVMQLSRAQADIAL